MTRSTAIVCQKPHSNLSKSKCNSGRPRKISSPNKSLVLRKSGGRVPRSEIVSSGQAQKFLESFYQSWEQKQISNNNRSKKRALKLYSRALIRSAKSVDISQHPKSFVALVRAHLCAYEKDGEQMDEEALKRRASYYESILIFEEKYAQYLFNQQNLPMLSLNDRQIIYQNVKLSLKSECSQRSIPHSGLERNLIAVIGTQSSAFNNLRQLFGTATDLI